MSRNNIPNSRPRAKNLCRESQNMKEVNSLSRQEVEEKHKKNGDKEILVVT